MSAAHPAVLVVVGDDQEQKDLRCFLSDLGFHEVVGSTHEGARALMEEHRFPIAIVDTDTSAPGLGLELVRALKQVSPATRVLVLTGYKSFDVVLGALRAGAADVVVKARDQIDYLQKRLLSLSREEGEQREREGLLGESVSLNEEFLLRLRDQARRIGALSDQLREASSSSSPLPDDEICRVLVVEEDGWLSQALVQLLPRGFVFHTVVSGGSALDKASVQRFHIALVKEGLPDLPGRMVVRTLTAQSPETITLLFSPPAGIPGQVQLIDASQTIMVIPEFTDPAQLSERLPEIHQAQLARGRERRYLSTFREEHHDLLRRMSELRHKLGRG